ncbi:MULTISPECIES: hypothetical protein [unclassified Clostridium]|uniref:5' nucleotidase, NT5C type n=1 Tax=unclassified Clostridium TaxID=2614128 RepID=UPI0002983633|nr:MULTISPECIES: hypothetical protein [unclassified Clostridium]EKQ57258.1 MAG: hypothetical protein A370_01075 [Clostridium sp. Maddingley MBC34-26]
MKKLNICIDIDGTITDPYYWLSHANSYFNCNISEEQVTCYEIANVLNVKESDYLEFYDKLKVKIHTEEKLRDDVKEILNKVFENNNIYFVTAREKSLELLTFLYLKEHGIPFDELYVLGTHNKVPKAFDLDCDIFIEDSYDNALQLSQSGFFVILLDTNYNRFELNENIVRVSNWTEVLQIINEFIKESEAI